VRASMTPRMLLALVICATASVTGLAQTPPNPTPTETTTPGIAGVVTAGTKVQLVAQGLRGTEGPVAEPGGTLLFTENVAGVISRVDAKGAISPYLKDTNSASGLTFDRKGRLIGTRPDTHAIAVFAPEPVILVDAAGGLPLMRPNDLTVDRKDGIYFTDPGPVPQPGQTPARKPAVYYIPPGGTVVTVADDITRPNGVVLSPDEKVLYVADTLGESVVAFDVNADGTLRNRRIFGKLDGVTKTDTGVRSGADGLAVDAAGRLYVATQAGIQVFSPTAQHLGTIVIGITGGPQNMAFAGPGKKTLYVVGRGAMWQIATTTRGPDRRGK
jgi:gluconolactonase